MSKTVEDFIREFAAFPSLWTADQFHVAVRSLTNWSSERDRYVALFNAPEKSWSQDQWLQVVHDIALEHKLSSKRTAYTQPETLQRQRRGRPKSATALNSQAVNYQALAAQSLALIEQAAQQGQKLLLTNAVRRVMKNSDKTLNGTTSNVESQFKTAYTEVRKLLAKKKRGKNAIG